MADTASPSFVRDEDPWVSHRLPCETFRPIPSCATGMIQVRGSCAGAGESIRGDRRGTAGAAEENPGVPPRLPVRLRVFRVTLFIFEAPARKSGTRYGRRALLRGHPAVAAEDVHHRLARHPAERHPPSRMEIQYSRRLPNRVPGSVRQRKTSVTPDASPTKPSTTIRKALRVGAADRRRSTSARYTQAAARPAAAAPTVLTLTIIAPWLASSRRRPPTRPALPRSPRPPCPAAPPAARPRWPP
jgi:hypothetical protein